MKFNRVFTTEGKSAYAGIKFDKRTSEIKNLDGSTSSSVEVVVPNSWSQVASDIIAQKYFRRAGVPQTDDKGKLLLDEKGKPVLDSGPG